MRSEKRMRNKMISIRLTDDEYEYIHNLAKNYGISAPSMMRSAALSYTVKSVYDQRLIKEISSIHSELNKIGGLLKIAFMRYKTAELLNSLSSLKNTVKILEEKLRKL